MKQLIEKIFYSSALLLGANLFVSTTASAQFSPLPGGFSSFDSVTLTNDSAGIEVFLPSGLPTVPGTLVSSPNTPANINEALQGLSFPELITSGFPTPTSPINLLANRQPGNPINEGGLLTYDFPPNGPVGPGFPWRPGFSSPINSVGGNLDLGRDIGSGIGNWATDRTTVTAVFDGFGTIELSSLTSGDWFNQVVGDNLVSTTNYNEANDTQFARVWVDDFFNFYRPLFDTTIGDVIPSLATSFNPAIPNGLTDPIVNRTVQSFLDASAGQPFTPEYVYNRLANQSLPGQSVSGFQSISNPNVSTIVEIDLTDPNSGPEAEEYFLFTVGPTRDANRGVIFSLETTYFGSDVIFQLTQGQTLRQAITGGLNTIANQLNAAIPGPNIPIYTVPVADLTDEGFEFFLANPVQLVEPIRVNWNPEADGENTVDFYSYAWQAAVSGQFNNGTFNPDFPSNLGDLEFLGESYSGTYDPALVSFVAQVPPEPPVPGVTPEPSSLVAILGLGALFATKKLKK